MLIPNATETIRGALIGGVRAIFNDQARGERPIARSNNGLFAPNSVAWRVHGDVTSMMVGGITALLLQMLHPAALAGIWDHSNFRNDMLGRLRRTARFIATTTFADRSDALKAIDWVKQVHSKVRGTLPDGTHYSADDPQLLGWVHVTEALCFLRAWKRYGEPDLSLADQNAYFAEFATVARLLGADPVPETRDEAEVILEEFTPQLFSSARTREIARLVIHQRPLTLATAPLQAMITEAAIDLLPDWSKRMHGLSVFRPASPIAQLSTSSVAAALRWAFAGARSRVQTSTGV